MKQVWIRNGLVWTGGDEPGVFAGGVLCDGDRIVAVGPDADLEPAAHGALTIDAGGRLVVPGFINAHMHLYSTFARGLSLGGSPPENFVEILNKLWWRLDRTLTLEDLGPGAEVVLLDALRAGITTIIDHHASNNAIDGSLDVLAGAARKLGLRLSSCYEVSDRDGPETLKAAIAENVRFARAAESDPMLAAMFGLHASFTLSDDSLELCAAAGREAGLAFHVHVAEASPDAEDARHRGYTGALSRLHTRGLITPGSLAVHCVHTSPEEWALVKKAGAFVVHNPQSNMNNAVGAAPVCDMIANGVDVGIGTDGMEADVREEIRAAFLLGHHATGDPRTMWSEIESLLAANRRIASNLFGRSLGVLAPGAAADVVVYGYYPPTAFEPENFTGHLLFGFYRTPASTVIVGGKVRLREGVPVDIDPAEVAARARVQARSLWSRF
ncbi:MAG TPA: putative aminohydrolase SsnA [Myxococcota bacterium]|nr:putative aminohydrolase SsnA [Myxococcota bacterium]